MTEKKFLKLDAHILNNKDAFNFPLYKQDSGIYSIFTNAGTSVEEGTAPEDIGELFVSEEDETALTLYFENHLLYIIKQNDLSNASKVDIIYDVSNRLIKDFFREKTPELQKRVEKFIATVMIFLFTSGVTLNEIIRLSEKDHHFYRHLLHSAIYAAVLLPFIGVKNPVIMKKVIFAAYIHDIGKSRFPMSIIDKAVLNEKQRLEMSNHPIHGANILKIDLKIKDEIIEGMILNHHEFLDGSGYPRRKKGLKVVEKAMTIIDSFDNQTYKKSGVGEKTFEQTFNHMTGPMVKKLDQSILRQFTFVIKKRWE